MASRRDNDMTTAFIERFRSRDQHLWKKRKESNSYRIFLEHQHGCRFIVLEHQYGSNDVMWKRSITSRVVWSLVWNVIRHFAPHPNFLIAFARGHENAIVTDSNITLWEHAHIMVTLSVTIFFSKVSVFNHPLGSFSTTTATAPRTAKKAIGLY